MKEKSVSIRLLYIFIPIGRWFIVVCVISLCVFMLCVLAVTPTQLCLKIPICFRKNGG